MTGGAVWKTMKAACRAMKHLVGHPNRGFVLMLFGMEILILNLKLLVKLILILLKILTVGRALVVTLHS